MEISRSRSWPMVINVLPCPIDCSRNYKKYFKPSARALRSLPPGLTVNFGMIEQSRY